MLQLSSRSAQRIGTSYICASCLAASLSTRPSTLRPALTIPSSHYGRLLSTTSSRTAPAVEPESESKSSTLDTEAGTDKNIEPPLQKSSKKGSKKKKSKKVSKEAPTKATGERQLQVLQGALQALKNVLAAQNINVDQKGKPKNQDSEPQPEAKATVKPKPKSKPKSKPKTKPAKAKLAKSKGKVPTKRSTASPQNEKTKSTEETPNSPQLPLTGRIPPRSNYSLRNALRDLQNLEANGQSPTIPYSASISAVQKGDYRSIGEPFTGKKPPLPLFTDKPPSPTPSPQVTKSTPESPPWSINSIHANELYEYPIDTKHPPVPSLSYGLDRVLFNPGVYYLQEPRSRVYNFDPYLAEIMPIQEFDFNALKQYVTSSKDSTLIGIAKAHGKKYTGSTSSMTSMLSHFHYLLSSWREINTNMLSRSFVPDSVRFTRIMTGPAATFLHWKDGTYAIDADKEFDTANILSMLGKSMEKLLTLSKEEYERYRHTNSDQITEEERNADEAFHYTGFQDFMMRSQLDAYDPRVPGYGMFDLKTRAVVSIRMDARGFQKGLGYEIRDRLGQWNSFEREYYDMIRSAFLKYSLQVRMGRMDGIFVAFHNTQRIFGFQYIPLSEMDWAIHGTSNIALGNMEYKASLSLLNTILNRITEKFPEQSLRLHIETRTSITAPFMYIFAKPVTPHDIEEVQSSSRKSIEEFEKDILGVVKEVAKAESEIESESTAENDDVFEEEDEEVTGSAVDQEMSSLAAWKEVRRVVEDAMDDDEMGVGTVREAIEDALEQSGLLHARSSIEARGYVDALLDAVTSGGKPTDSTESPSITQAEDEEDDAVLADEQDEESSEIMDSAQDSEKTAEVPLQESAPEQSPIEGMRVEETSREPSELASGRTPEEDDGEVQNKPNESNTHISNPPDNGQHHVETESDDPASIDEIASQPQANTNTFREIEEEEDDDEVDETDDELEAEDSKRDPNATSTMSPLTTLIVKMAQRIDDDGGFADEADSSLDDSSKLKEFERILGELIARSKEGQTQPPTQDTDSTPDAGADLKAQDIIDSIKSKASNIEETGDAPESSAETPAEDEGPLLGLVLTIKNRVNGNYVVRPKDLTRRDRWDIEYNIEELSAQRAQTIYKQCKARRQKVFNNKEEDKDSEWYKMFRGSLDKHTQRGRKFRARETAEAKKRPVHILGQKPQHWEDVFGKPK
ncbi:Pet127-domain-containing protein [Hypomontagnella monticulosa]|nr:Pet127-domain-containing protein [Hypomontagnella monticulosa]